jgi:prepilin-type processing-associated H-X9-DG protein
MVAMVVIGVLAALVLSVLGRGKESANAARCSSNLGQIGQAIAGYCADNEGRLPGPLDEQQKNDLSSVVSGSLLGLLRSYLDAKTSSGGISGPSVFTCPAWEQKDLSKKTAVFVMNVQDTMPEQENRVPWGSTGVEPVRLANLAGWNPRPGGSEPRGLATIWAMRDGNFSPPDQKGLSVHGDFRNALFYDWHVGRLNLSGEPK